MTSRSGCCIIGTECYEASEIHGETEIHGKAGRIHRTARIEKAPNRVEPIERNRAMVRVVNANYGIRLVGIRLENPHHMYFFV